MNQAPNVQGVHESSPLVFLAAAAPDEELARSLARMLERRGLETWWFGHEITPGMDWQRETDAALERADAVLVTLTRHALSSDTVQRVLALAERLAKPVVVVQTEPMEGMQVPEHWRARPTFLLTPRMADSARERIEGRLVDALRTVAEGKELTASQVWDVATDREIEVPSPAKFSPTKIAWRHLDDDARAAFQWAEALRVAGGKEQVGAAELYGGLLAWSESADPNLYRALAGAGVDGPEPEIVKLYERLGLIPVTSPATLAELPPTDDAVRRAVRDARALPPGNRERALPVELAGALLAPEDPGQVAPADAVLARAEIDVEQVLEGLLGPEESTETFALVREVRRRRRIPAAWDRAGFDSDRVSGAVSPDQDRLDAKRPALRFAKLLASTQVKPPIALGLFGNWGSGKTFFMGLMRDRIADLAKNGGEGYVRRVVQIEFNAWHYHDTSLWACLAMRIFDGLAQELQPPKESDLEKVRRELHQRLSSSEAQRAHAESVRDAALAKRSRARRFLERIEQRKAKRLKQSLALRMKAAWQYWSQRERKELDPGREKVEALAKQFGVSGSLDSLESIAELRSQLDGLKAQGSGLVGAVQHRFRGVRSGVVTVLVLLAIALVGVVILPASGLTAESIARQFHRWGWTGLADAFLWLAFRLRTAADGMSLAAVQIATMVTAVVAWCSRRVRQISSGLELVAKVEEGLREAEKRALVDDDELRVRKKIALLDQAIARSTEEVQESDRLIAEATAEIERIDRGGLVYDFLADRRASAQYTSQLGLVSTIRNDFDQLGALLRDFTEKGKQPIERIVLYIDDLDRCHPDKVVEVLQAVHLLLAFDLFNVVVGVDARWLERSLHRQYVGRLGGSRKGAESEFSPHDYLEKIFQIPYMLAPMDPGGFGTLVQSMVVTRSDHEAKVRQEAEAQRAAQQKLEAAALAATTVTERQGGQTTVTAEPASARAETGEATVSVTPASKARVAQFFEDHEEAFIRGLHGFIDRPRLAKRFVNIYRLLRVRAEDEQEGARFAGDAGAEDYRAALLLLAINVGFPRLSTRFLREVGQAGSAESWPELLRRLTGEGAREMVRSEEDRRELARLARAVNGVADQPSDIAPYVRWAPRVACFSFGWHDLSNGGEAPAAQRHASA